MAFSHRTARTRNSLKKNKSRKNVAEAGKRAHLCPLKSVTGNWNWV